MDGWDDIYPKETGFRDGVAMWFDPETLGLHVLENQQTILGVDVGQHLRDALANHADRSTTRGEIFSGVPEAAANFFITHNHERDHLCRTLGTSFGLFIHHLQCGDAELLQRRFAESTLDPKAHPFPLFSSEEALSLRKKIHKEGTESFLRIFNDKTREQDLALFCSRKTLVRALVDGIPKQDLSLALCGLLTIPSLRTPPLDLNTDNPDYLDQKSCLELKGHKLNGRSLMEFMATYQGLNAMIQMGGRGGRAMATLMNGGEYSLIAQLWDGLLGEESRFSTADNKDDSFDLAAYRTMPLEFYAALDLALWIPVGPSGIQSNGKEIFWADMDPGIRFWRCLDLYKNSDLKFSSTNSEDRNERFRETQAALSQQFGWPTPEELSNEWLTFFESARNHGSFEGYFIESPKDKRYSLVSALLNERAKAPLDLVLNNLPITQTTSFSSWWIGAAHEPREIKPQWDDPDRYYAFKNYTLTKLCARLLCGQGTVQLSKENMKQSLLGLSIYCGQRTTNFPQTEFVRTASTFLGLD